MTNRHESSVGTEAVGMQATKSLTPHVEIILSLRVGHKMIYIFLIGGFMKSSCKTMKKNKKVHKVLAHYLFEACLRTVKITGPA